jgi:SAM-dependent methyltransferase
VSELPSEAEYFVRQSPIFRRPIASFVQQAAEQAAPGARVLDAGSGSQPYRSLFTHCEYVAQDWTASVHAQARQADIVADLAQLPVEDERFDLIVCTEVLEHVGDPAAVLAELFRVSARGGRLALTVPFVIELHEEPHDHFRYTSYALRNLLEQAGFEQIDVRPLSGWFSTLAAILRNAKGSIVPTAGRAPLATSLVGLLMIALSEPLRLIAPTLDRLDRRRSFPTGWSVSAKRPTA